MSTGMEDKREVLGDQLKLGYRKINSLNVKTRKVKAAQDFVKMKKDKIDQQVAELLRNLSRVLDEMKLKFQDNLNTVVNDKIAELDSEVEEIQNDVCMLMEMCVESEKALKVGNEGLLEKHSSALVRSFDMLFESDSNTVDYDSMIAIYFTPNNLVNMLLEKGLGYIVTDESSIYPSPDQYTAHKCAQVSERVKRLDIGTQTQMTPDMSNIMVGPNGPPGTNLFGASPSMMMPPLPINLNKNYIGPGLFPNQYIKPASFQQNNHPPNQNENRQSTGNVRFENNEPPMFRDYVAGLQKMGCAEKLRPLFSTDLSNPDTQISKSLFVNRSSCPTDSNVSQNTDHMDNVKTLNESRFMRPPRLPEVILVDRLVNSSIVSSKIKMPVSSTPKTEGCRQRTKSFNVRFSPTFSSESIDNNIQISPDATTGLYMPKSIQELRNLQRDSYQIGSSLVDKSTIQSETAVSQSIVKKPSVAQHANRISQFKDLNDNDTKQHDNLVYNQIKSINTRNIYENIPQKYQNESWDEELVSIEQPLMFFSEKNTEERIMSPLRNGGSKVLSDDVSRANIPVNQSYLQEKNDSGIATDMYTPKKRPPIITETGQTKSIDLAQFKCLFEKHIESNENIPLTGQNVNCNHLDPYQHGKNQEAVVSKPKEIDKIEPHAVEFCIANHIFAQSNWKEIEASLSYVVGKPGKGATFSEILNFPIGVNINSKGEIIVNDTSNHLVKKFCRNSVLSVMGLEDVQMQRPSAIVVNKNDDIFVKDNMAIYVFDARGTFKYSFGKDVLKMPYGLVLTEDETLLVLDIHRPSPCLYEFSQDGQLLSCHSYQPLENSQPMSKCRFMAYHNGKLLVSDLGRSTMYLTNRKGELVRQFSRKGRNPGEFNEPSGVTVDADGHWIVADSKNNRLQVFKPNGEFLSVIQFMEPVVRPSDIHLTTDGRLLVVDFLAHIVKVYTLTRS